MTKTKMLCFQKTFVEYPFSGIDDDARPYHIDDYGYKRVNDWYEYHFANKHYLENDGQIAEVNMLYWLSPKCTFYITHAFHEFCFVKFIP